VVKITITESVKKVSKNYRQK